MFINQSIFFIRVRPSIYLSIYLLWFQTIYLNAFLLGHLSISLFIYLIFSFHKLISIYLFLCFISICPILYFNILHGNCIIYHKSLLLLIISHPHHQHSTVSKNSALLNKATQTQKSPTGLVPVTRVPNIDVRIRRQPTISRYVTVCLQLLNFENLPYLSLATSPYRSSPLASLQGFKDTSLPVARHDDDDDHHTSIAMENEKFVREHLNIMVL